MKQGFVVYIPKQLQQSVCDLPESSRGSTIAKGSILKIWTRLRSIKPRGFHADLKPFFKLFAYSLCLGLLTAIPTTSFSKEQYASNDYQPKEYSSLLGIPGFSDSLLKMHFQLYEGYVKNTNLLLNRLKELELQDRSLTYEYGALKRRLGWEFDGMRLHELYFDHLGGSEPLGKDSSLYSRLLKDFGSYEAWKKNFIATGMMRGIGWVILYRDNLSGKLINTWINEHDVGHLAGGEPLLVMDVFEHAYITQYGLDRAKYINAFFDNIQWSKVSKKYDGSIR